MAPEMAIAKKQYICDICQKCYKTKCTLQYHQYSHDPGRGTFICELDDCKRSFKNPKRLSDHKRRYHRNSENYMCEFCGYYTRIKCNLEVHRRKHTGEKPYCCEYCANGFASSYQLNIHREIHKGNRKYFCYICGDRFNDSKALYHHEFLHVSENKYDCKLCKKTFKQSAGLSQHIRWHRKQLDRCTDIIKVIT